MKQHKMILLLGFLTTVIFIKLHLLDWNNRNHKGKSLYQESSFIGPHSLSVKNYPSANQSLYQELHHIVFKNTLSIKSHPSVPHTVSVKNHPPAPHSLFKFAHPHPHRLCQDLPFSTPPPPHNLSAKNHLSVPLRITLHHPIPSP